MSLLDQATALLFRVIPYLEYREGGLLYYERWVKDCCDDPDFPGTLAVAAKSNLVSDNEQLVCSALQALAVVGTSEDISVLREHTLTANELIARNAALCLAHLLHRMKKLDDLLEEVTDWKTFVRFATELADERQRAFEIESSNSDNPAYLLNGALGWNNGDIQSFLWAALSYFPSDMSEDDPRAVPSWRSFAEMLYYGKIIE